MTTVSSGWFVYSMLCICMNFRFIIFNMFLYNIFLCVFFYVCSFHRGVLCPLHIRPSVTIAFVSIHCMFCFAMAAWWWRSLSDCNVALLNYTCWELSVQRADLSSDVHAFLHVPCVITCCVSSSWTCSSGHECQLRCASRVPLSFSPGVTFLPCLRAVQACLKWLLARNQSLPSSPSQPCALLEYSPTAFCEPPGIKIIKIRMDLHVQ